MYNIFLSIACSVSVGILIKLLRKRDPQMTQIITWNYFFALLLCYFLFEPDLALITSASPWPVYISLAFFLPGIFLALAASIKYMGIVKTDAAQRMSLCIPLLAAWLLFNENFGSQKIIGLAIGLPALMMILWKKSDNSEQKWVYPLVVTLGFGIIDILFKQVALYTVVPYTTSLFVIFALSLLVAACYVGYEAVVKKIALRPANILFGLVLGTLNFGNIYFYLRAHKVFSDNPSTVFAMMNIGVIVLGSVVGVLAFREKLSKLNYVGLALAVVSIVVIAYMYHS